MTLNPRILTGVIVVAMAIVLPLAATPAWQGIMTKMLIAALFATGYNLLLGQAGLLSFGHAAFYGIGAIATLHAMNAVERGVIYIPLPLLPLVGAAAGFLLALIAGYFATKRSGTYFALVTLAMAELIHVIAPMWQTVFGGEAGLTSMRMPSLGFGFDREIHVYMLTLFWSAAGIGALWFLSRTAFGQLTLALKGNEQRLKFLGFDTYRSKVLTFAISGTVAGLAGSLLSISTETANYTLFSAEVSTQVVFFTFIGGPAFFFGPAIAAAALTAIPYQISNYTHAWPLYQGMFFMVVMLTTPSGLGGLLAGRLKAGEHLEDTLRMRKRLLVGLAIVGVVAGFLESVIRLRQSGVPHMSFDSSLGIWLLLLALAAGIATCLLHRRLRVRTAVSGKAGFPARDAIGQKTSDAG
jgi:branched-chain amino acid transport system permease protein